MVKPFIKCKNESMGSNVHLGTWEVLDTPEKRRAVALALADREVRADQVDPDSAYKPIAGDDENAHKTQYGTKRKTGKDDDDGSTDKMNHTAKNYRSQMGQDGIYYADKCLDKDKYYRNKEGNLEKAHQSDKYPYIDHHGKDYVRKDDTKDDAPIDHDVIGHWIDKKGEKRPLCRTKLLVSHNHSDIPLKVSSKSEPMQGETANKYVRRLKNDLKTPEEPKDTRETGYTTGRYRGYIRNRLDKDADQDSKYFKDNPEKKKEVDNEYQKKMNRSYFDKVSQKADDLAFSPGLPSMVKAHKLQRAKIASNRMHPLDGSKASKHINPKYHDKYYGSDDAEHHEYAEKERIRKERLEKKKKAKSSSEVDKADVNPKQVKNRTLGNAQYSSSADGSKVKKQDTVDLEKEAKRANAMDTQIASIQNNNQVKHSQDKEQLRLAAYNKARIALNSLNLSGTEHAKREYALKTRYGIKHESLPKPEETLRPEFQYLLQDLRQCYLRT